MNVILVAVDTIRAAIGNAFAPQPTLTAQSATFTACYATLTKEASIKDFKDSIRKIGRELRCERRPRDLASEGPDLSAVAVRRRTESAGSDHRSSARCGG